MTIDLYPGVGKAETEIQRITELATLPNAAALPVFRGRRGILHITTRHEVESMDFSRLVASLGPGAELERIRHLLGRTSYTISGYGDDARELYEIPEVRRFYSTSFDLCPALIVAADLRNECLRAVIFCVLENLNVIHRLDTDRVGVQAESHVLEAFFLALLRSQAAFHKRLGWSRPHGGEELKSLEDYLGILASAKRRQNPRHEDR